MSDLLSSEPSRPLDQARLQLARLCIEDGIGLASVFEQVTETAAETLGIERAGIWLFVDERSALRCVDLFERSKATHSSGATLQVRDFPAYFAALEQRKSVPAEVARVDPRTSELAQAYLIPLGITSMLDAPIFIAGDVVGVICHEHTGPAREWTTEERDFASSMADLLALKMRAAEMAEARLALRTQAEQLAELRRMRSLGEMAAGVAHDFKNILGAILTAVQLVTDDRRCLDQMLKHIATAGQQGLKLANELMAFASPGPVLARVIRPADILKAQIPLLQITVGNRHPIRLNVCSAIGRVLIAPDQLERAMLNLVVNARDAMPQGGPITIQIEDVSDRNEEEKMAHFVQIAISDTGTGIPPDVLPNIFDPFFTTKPRGQGTGLGLAIVHQIVTHAGGMVRVESTVGQGTTFRLQLPRVSSKG